MIYMEGLPAVKLENMTYEIYANVYQQLMLAKVVKDNYKGSTGIELGMMAARIHRTYANMLEIYRKFADYKKFKKLEPDMDDVLTAYQTILGQYSKIRIDQKLFIEVQKKHEQERDDWQQEWENMGNIGPAPNKADYIRNLKGTVPTIPPIDNVRRSGLSNRSRPFGHLERSGPSDRLRRSGHLRPLRLSETSGRSELSGRLKPSGQLGPLGFSVPLGRSKPRSILRPSNRSDPSALSGKREHSGILGRSQTSTKKRLWAPGPEPLMKVGE